MLCLIYLKQFVPRERVLHILRRLGCLLAAADSRSLLPAVLITERHIPSHLTGARNCLFAVDPFARSRLLILAQIVLADVVIRC